MINCVKNSECEVLLWKNGIMRLEIYHFLMHNSRYSF